MTNPKKTVTIVVFGPSMKLGIPAIGEVWTINRAYSILPANVMDACTRYFEMHTHDHLRLWRGHDGKPHVHHLDALGRAGKRIIMQSPHPKITASETFPLTEIQSRWPRAMFSGGEQFPLAMAIHEGYEHIRIIVVDPYVLVEIGRAHV